MKEVQEKVKQTTQEDWKEFEHGCQRWCYTMFSHSCKAWEREYQTVYANPHITDNQIWLEFVRPESILVTNLGTAHWELSQAHQTQAKELFDGQWMIASNRARGADELAYRGIKDFGFEQLPFGVWGKCGFLLPDGYRLQCV